MNNFGAYPGSGAAICVPPWPRLRRHALGTDVPKRGGYDDDGGFIAAFTQPTAPHENSETKLSVVNTKPVASLF